jgi:hypothetical protein
VTRLKQACCVPTAGVAALAAAVATAATWPDQPAAALSATSQGISCNAVAGAYQFPGADGVMTPAA